MKERLKTRQELAQELGISYHTLLRRIKEGNLKVTVRKYLTPKDQETILNYLLK